jgi:hypothetical protein
MPDEQDSQDEKNRAIVAALRESFAAQTKRLTFDVEPATVYTLVEPLANDD